MTKPPNLEYWLRGPVPGIPPLLQPVAHALLQARAEVNALMAEFPEQKLWERPAGLASSGFHLQHLAGVLDRLLTYARGEGLSQQQLADLASEGKPRGAEPTDPEPTDLKGTDPKGTDLKETDLKETNLKETNLDRFNMQIDKALQQLGHTPEEALTEPRAVGRAGVPSTVIGLLFHAAEHTMRHTGQLLVTARILEGHPDSGNRSDQ
jgi:DinB superfamily/Pentapeptide repeats (8 copies)